MVSRDYRDWGGTVNGPEVTTAQPPRVLDTYSMAYAFILLFLFPGSLLIGQLPFRTYTFQYVSLIAVPFVLGLVLTFLTDSTESLRTRLVRMGILIPIILMTGVTVMFTSSMFLWPVAQVLNPGNFNIAGPIAAVILLGTMSPLLFALVRRMRGPFTAIALLQSVALAAAVLLAGGVVYLSLTSDLLATIARKDIIIYIVGGLTWYLPSFGIAAGVWRRLELV